MGWFDRNVVSNSKVFDAIQAVGNFAEKTLVTAGQIMGTAIGVTIVSGGNIAGSASNIPGSVAGGIAGGEIGKAVGEMGVEGIHDIAQSWADAVADNPATQESPLDIEQIGHTPEPRPDLPSPADEITPVEEPIGPPGRASDKISDDVPSVDPDATFNSSDASGLLDNLNESLQGLEIPNLMEQLNNQLEQMEDFQFQNQMDEFDHQFDEFDQGQQYDERYDVSEWNEQIDVSADEFSNIADDIASIDHDALDYDTVGGDEVDQGGPEFGSTDSDDGSQDVDCIAGSFDTGDGEGPQ